MLFPSFSFQSDPRSDTVNRVEDDFWLFILIPSSFLLIFSIWLLRYYSPDRRDIYRTAKPRLYVLIPTFIGWFFSFSIIVLLPLDIYLTMLAVEKKDLSAAKLVNGPVRSLWVFVYWIQFFWTWLVIPLLQSFVESGSFTFWTKLGDAFKTNMKFYAALSVVMLIGLVWIIFAKHLDSFQDIVGFCIASSNIYGLILFVLLLGYGIVEYPKKLFHKGSKKFRLAELLFRISQTQETQDLYHSELSDIYGIALAFKDSIRIDDELYPTVCMVIDTCKTLCPKDICRYYATGRNDSNLDRKKYPLSIVGLAKIRAQVLQGALRYYQSKLQLDALFRKTFRIQMVIRTIGPNKPWEPPTLDSDPSSSSSTGPLGSHIAARSRSHSGNGGLSLSSQNSNGLLRPYQSGELDWEFCSAPFLLRIFPSFQRLWYSKLSYFAYTSIACVMAIFGIIIIWTEMTITSPTNLSPFAALIDLTDLNPMSTLLVVAIPLFFLCLCAYWALFHAKIYRYYSLIPHHSNDNSLLFSAAYLCRLAPAICYNYLTLIHQDFTSASGSIGVQSTGFLAAMGPMNLVPVSGSAMLWIPILLVIFCLISLFNITSRILNFFQFERFHYSDELYDVAIRPNIATRAEFADNSVIKAVAKGVRILDREYARLQRESAGKLAFRNVHQSGRSASLALTNPDILPSERLFSTPPPQQNSDISESGSNSNSNGVGFIFDFNDDTEGPRMDTLFPPRKYGATTNFDRI